MVFGDLFFCIGDCLHNVNTQTGKSGGVALAIGKGVCYNVLGELLLFNKSSEEFI